MVVEIVFETVSVPIEQQQEMFKHTDRQGEDDTYRQHSEIMKYINSVTLLE